MKAELIPEDGGAPIRITRDVTVVGRREACDVRVNHPSLSRRHCVIVKTDGLLYVRDLASTNGTKVKGQRIRSAALMPNDRISLGKCKFRVYLGPDHVPSPSENPGNIGLTPVTPIVPGSGSYDGPFLPVSFPTPTPLGLPVVLAPADLLGAASEPRDARYLPESAPPSRVVDEFPLLTSLAVEDDDLLLADSEESINLDLD